MVALFFDPKKSFHVSYRQLTEGQRYQISTLLSLEFSLREIAKKLNIATSTVSQELQQTQVQQVNMTLIQLKTCINAPLTVKAQAMLYEYVTKAQALIDLAFVGAAL